MVSELLKTNTVFLVNFMHQEDAPKYGGWFFPREENPDIEPSIKSWKGKVSFEMQHDLKGWDIYAYKMDDHPLSLYNYQTWKDHGEGEMHVIISMVKELYAAMKLVINPVVILNCRGGVGRTGTFAILLYFYGLIQEKKSLNKEDFNLEAIKNKIMEYRKARGDVQFVQSKEQFGMLCRLIENMFNEAIS